MPTDRSSRPTDARRSGSSSMTNTAEVASDIALLGRDRKNQPVAWLQALPDRAFLAPILEPEQPHFLPEDARGVHQYWHSSPLSDARVDFRLKFDLNSAR